jgi:hypothetical protein
MYPVATALLAAVLVAAPASAGPPRGRTLDKKFWLLTAATASVTVVDVQLTQYYLHRDPWRRELNPIFGPHPSRARMYATVAAENLGAAYLAYRLKKSQHRRLRRLWWLPQTLVITGHGVGLVVTVRQ